MCKFKAVFGSILLALSLVTNANAHTIDFVNVLPHLFGDPLDLENINGKFRIRPHRNYYIHYDSDDLSSVIPDNKLANLKVVWKKKKYNGFKKIRTWTLTDDVGAIIKQEFWLTLVCHRDYILKVSSQWIGDDDIIPNPLPPSVIAFLSAMTGIGYMVRRRRSQTI